MSSQQENICKVTYSTSLSGTSESTLQKSSTKLLLGRLRLLAMIGFVISIIMYFATSQLLPINLYATHTSTLTSWGELIFHGHKLSFGLASALLVWAGWNWRQLVAIDYLLITFNIIVACLGYAVCQPQIIPDFSIALLLFVHAAFIPCRIRVQAGLAITALVAYPLIQVLVYRLVPEVQQHWVAEGGSRLLNSHLLNSVVHFAVLGVVSIFITRILYQIRKDLRKAERYGNYIIERELGSGGMGKVYIASHALLCRPTAIKIMNPQNEADQSLAAARFEREVTLSSTLTHPNTITIFDYGRTSNNTFYYVMEYLEGMDIQRFVEKFGPIAANRSVFVLRQVCGSLAEAHTRNIIHRDVKPSNIFLTNCGGIYDFVKVLDFGLAKEAEGDRWDTATQTGIFLGTPRYIAPETVYGKGEVDGRSDIYNLGAVAYWMLTGKPLFAGSSNVEVIVDHVKTEPKRPSEISELPIPEELDDIIMRCLQKDPKDRFQTAEEMSIALLKVPLGEPWDEHKAKEWWQLHAPGEIRAVAGGQVDELEETKTQERLSA